MMNYELEDYIVQDPYQPTEKEKLAIEELTNRGLVPEDWNSNKVGITEFKDHIREYMYYEQNCRCAYCRIEIPIGCCFGQREHIVPKKLHPKWIFEPSNLCFACDRCNNFKWDEEVLKKPHSVAYPTDSKAFMIINPFLDKYSDHIKLKEGIIYVGKTKKGRFTIDTCHLYRPDLALERAKQRMVTENTDTVRTQLLALLSTICKSDEEKNKTLKNFEKIVDIYKKKHKA